MRISRRLLIFAITLISACSMTPIYAQQGDSFGTPVSMFGPITARTGTLTSTGTAVVGTTTDFENEQLSIGDQIRSDGQRRYVATVTDATHLTTTVAFSPALSGDSFTYRDRVVIVEEDGDQISKGAGTFAKGIIVNDSGGDNDTQIKGDTDANLLYGDASTNRVGIGTATPLSLFHVNGEDDAVLIGPAPTQAASAFGDNLVITQQSGAGVGLSLISNGTDQTAIFFGDSSSAGAGQFKYSHADNQFIFGTFNGATRMTLDATKLDLVNVDLTVTAGDVGVGPSSPDTTAHLSVSTTNPGTPGPILRLERDDDGIGPGESYGTIEWEGQDTTADNSAGIRAKIVVVGNPDLGSAGDTDMVFYTADAGGGGAPGSGADGTHERMRLTSAGEIILGSAAANSTQFAADGFQTMTGTARVRGDINFGVEAFAPPGPGTDPELKIINNFRLVFAFEGGGGTTEEIFGSFEFPPDYEEGTDLKMHIHWGASGAGTGAVLWQMDWLVTAPNDSFATPSATGDAFTADAASETANQDQETAMKTFTDANWERGYTFHLRLFRDSTAGGDTYEADAHFLKLHISYMRNGLGDDEQWN